MLTGKVKSGMGNLSYWMEKLHDLYAAKTGMSLYPGSLNIELEDPFVLTDKTIRLEKEEYGGTVSLSMFPCKIFGRKAFILRTDKNAAGSGHHPLNIIEVISDVKLRDVYGLSDGDIVQVKLLDIN